MQKAKVWILVSTLLAVVMVLAACNSGTVTTGTTSVTGQVTGTITQVTTGVVTTTTPTTTQTTIAAPVDTTKPVYGGEIRYGFTLEAGGLDPLKLISGGDETYWRQMFDQLVDGGKKLISVPEFSLAETWETPDPTTMIFHLRKGVRFHDGTEFNAAAVKFNIERVLDPKNGSTYLTILAPIKTVTVVDTYTVKFDLKNSWGAFLGAIDSGAGSMSSPTAVNALGKEYAFKPVGTGPFVFSDYIGGASCLMKRNSNYWGVDSDGNPLPYLDSVRILIIPDQTVSIAALETGKLDIVGLPKQDVDRFQKNTKFNVFSTIGGISSQITFNISKAPMDNINLRKAIGYAVDPEEVNQAVYFGKSIVTKGDLWPVDSWAYDDDVGHPYYDPQKAKEYLALGGMPNGFTMTALTYSTPTIQKQAEIYQAQLAKVGIKLNLVLYDVTTATSKFYTQGEVALFFNSWSRRPEPDRVASLCYTSTSFYNPVKISNPTMDALVKEGASLYDIEARKAVYRKISLVTVGECWVLPQICDVVYMCAWKKISGTDTLLGWDTKERFKRVWIIK